MPVQILPKNCKGCNRQVAAQRNMLGAVGILMYFIVGWLTCGVVWVVGLIHWTVCTLSEFQCPQCGKKCGGDPANAAGLLAALLFGLVATSIFIFVMFKYVFV